MPGPALLTFHASNIHHSPMRRHYYPILQMMKQGLGDVGRFEETTLSQSLSILTPWTLPQDGDFVCLGPLNPQHL